MRREDKNVIVKLVRVLLVAALAAGVSPLFAADQFVKPTPEELAMTSLPGYQGASAVVLFDEEITKDDLHVITHYQRVKILNEEGKKYANVELNYVRTSAYGEYEGNEQTVGEIVGRTIHADGTIIPFTGKPYLKTIEKAGNFKVQSMVFTLPDVEVGSILEYRYATRYNDHSYQAPDWYIQRELYVKSAHYQWVPTLKDLIDPEDGDKQITKISWFPILPAGAKVDRTESPDPNSPSGKQQTFNLVIHDVPPEPKEDHMPPIAAYSYRVLFNFTPYDSAAEFWKVKGKQWSKRMDAFAGPNGDLKAATQTVITGATTDEDKLHKIYAAVMALENTRYTREHEARENKAEGGRVSNAADVLSHKRGSATDLTLLFIGMARAAGLEAYAMDVPDRSERLFTPGWMNFNQFNDIIAIVKVDGKERFFDPGARYCEFGHLEWQHTFVGGLRQTAGGTDIAQTAGDGYNANKRTRVANLTMDEEGKISGKIDLGFLGAPALRWRHRALSGDDESLRHGLRTYLEGMLPKSLEVKVTEIKNLEDYEKPLAVSYEVKGSMGTPTGKRLVMPVDLFTAGTRATFPQEKRELAVYFDYPENVQDALRVNFPKGFAVEATPADGKFGIPQRAAYNITTSTTPTSFTTRRQFAFGEFLVPPEEYATLRGFYSQFEAKDQESVVLKVAPAAAAGTPSGSQ
jgi:transglutaminase-like putative cysteine protease